MSEPFIGEIRPFALNFTPQGWLLCDGSRAYVQLNPVLYAVIGNLYGPSDGKNYFTLPNLQFVTPVHWGTSLPPNSPITRASPGVSFGVQTVTLTSSQIPAHTHTLLAGVDKKTAWTGKPTTTTYLATPFESATKTLYPTWDSAASGSMSPSSLGVSGNPSTFPAPHENCQPYLTFRFCIACEGIYPTHN